MGFSQWPVDRVDRQVRGRDISSHLRDPESRGPLGDGNPPPTMYRKYLRKYIGHGCMDGWMDGWIDIHDIADNS